MLIIIKLHIFAIFNGVFIHINAQEFISYEPGVYTSPELVFI